MSVVDGVDIGTSVVVLMISVSMGGRGGKQWWWCLGGLSPGGHRLECCCAWAWL